MSIFYYKKKEKQPIVIPKTWKQLFSEGKTLRGLTREELLELYNNTPLSSWMYERIFAEIAERFHGSRDS